MEKTVYWKDGALYAVEQTLLPGAYTYVRLETVDQICDAIYRLAIRGAPAIGVSGAYAVALAVGEAPGEDGRAILDYLEQRAPVIAAVRPTATNLAWAVNRCMALARTLTHCARAEFQNRILDLAGRISDEESENARRVSELGAGLLSDGMGIITHCNTGPLCTIEYGICMGAAIMAHQQGKQIHVYTDETRPRLQGAKLNTFELERYGVPYTLLTDNMAAYAMKAGLIDIAFVGADRVTANGDMAAKIGVYGLCVLAQAHGIPVYGFTPMSTVDFSLATGDEIQIEQRSPQEVLNVNGVQIAPVGTPVLNPAFDVTPHRYFSGIITDEGIAYPPFDKSLRELAERRKRRVQE